MEHRQFAKVSANDWNYYNIIYNSVFFKEKAPVFLLFIFLSSRPF